MNQRHWQIGIGIFVVVVIVAFMFSITHTQDGAVPKQAAADAPFTASSVVLKDTYTSKTTTHALTGSVVLPTPCYTLTAKSSVDTAADPQVIRLDLTVPTDAGMCLQLATPKTFSASVSAPKSALVSVFVNGVQASTTPK
jgi:hypothetical protein